MNQILRSRIAMKQKSIGVVKTQYYTYAENKNNCLVLECGRQMCPITVAYETYGKLNKDRTNAILVCHALSGDAHAAGFHGKTGNKPGWWEDAIGPGKALDTDLYYIICSNVLGGCSGTTGPASIDPDTGKPFGQDFPVVTIGDMVKVQKELLDHLGIDKLLTVIGGSMGGMQALEWVFQYPEIPLSSIVIASTSRLSAQSIAFNAVGRNAIISDHDWLKGNYYGKQLKFNGLSIARMIGHITYLSEASMHKKFGRRLQSKCEFSYDFSKEFQIESYLDYQGAKFVERFDANTYLYVTKAMDYFDIAQFYGNGSLAQACKKVKSKMLVLSFTSDWLFPPYQSKEIVDAMLKQKKDVTYVNIESSYGHDAFLLEIETESKIIRNFLAAVYQQNYNKKGVK
jgi:homoserine O-acetyltransferase/O-succinyltransferase